MTVAIFGRPASLLRNTRFMRLGGRSRSLVSQFGLNALTVVSAAGARVPAAGGEIEGRGVGLRTGAGLSTAESDQLVSHARVPARHARETRPSSRARRGR